MKLRKLPYLASRPAEFRIALSPPVLVPREAGSPTAYPAAMEAQRASPRGETDGFTAIGALLQEGFVPWSFGFDSRTRISLGLRNILVTRNDASHINLSLSRTNVRYGLILLLGAVRVKGKRTKVRRRASERLGTGGLNVDRGGLKS